MTGFVPSLPQDFTRPFCTKCQTVLETFHTITGIYVCQKCNTPVLASIYILKVQLEDQTGSLTANLYKEHAVILNRLSFSKLQFF